MRAAKAITSAVSAGPSYGVYALLLLVATLAWAWTIAGAGTEISAVAMTKMAGMDPASMRMPAPDWTLGYALLMFSMWWVMMMAMMLPSAAPNIVGFSKASSPSSTPGKSVTATISYTAGYLIVWGAFSAAATIAQWGLQSLDLVSPMLATNSARFGGSLLLAAGVWQLTPIRWRCLMQCKRNGPLIRYDSMDGLAALKAGTRYGLVCVACCWALMMLLFVGGVMNLYWIAGLTLLVLIEKTLPKAHLFSVTIGIALIAWGTAKVISIV